MAESVSKGAKRVLSDPAQDRFLAAMVDQYPDPVFVTDEEGTIRHWNDEMVDFVGYPREEVLGRPAYDVFQTDGESKTLAEVIVERGTSIREDDIRSAEDRFGERRHTRAKGIPIRDADGTVVGAMEVFERVTELVAAQERITRLQHDLSEEVEAGIDELNGAAADIADAATGMAADLDEQVESMEAVGEEVATFSATVEEIASSAEEVSAQSDHARSIAEESATRGESAQERVREMDETVQTLAEETADVEAQLDEITQVVDVINSIADQTNLLALNANIEAARADKSGDGFAVVANEIKALAEQSKEEVDAIESIVGDVQGDAREMIDMVEETTDAFASVAEELDALTAAQDDIASAIRETAQGVEEIADATDEQAASSEQIASVVEDAVEALRAVSNEVDEVAAATEEQTQQVSEMSQTIEDVERKVAAVTD